MTCWVHQYQFHSQQPNSQQLLLGVCQTWWTYLDLHPPNLSQWHNHKHNNLLCLILIRALIYLDQEANLCNHKFKLHRWWICLVVQLAQVLDKLVLVTFSIQYNKCNSLKYSQCNSHRYNPYITLSKTTLSKSSSRSGAQTRMSITSRHSSLTSQWVLSLKFLYRLLYRNTCAYSYKE